MPNRDVDKSALGPKYRQQAREAISRAKKELTSGEDRIGYVALELRQALEALTYARALMFYDEIPHEEYEVWQPRKLVRMLMEYTVDSIDEPYSIIIGGASGEGGVCLGSDRPITLKELNKHYDALGSFLHTQTVRQSKGSVPDLQKRKKRCETILEFVEAALASNAWSSLGQFSMLTCMRESCSNYIRRRVSYNLNQIEAKCFECKAGYDLTKSGDKFLWSKQSLRFGCETCKKIGEYWKCDIVEGNTVSCSSCGKAYKVVLGLTPLAIEPSS